MADPQEPRGDVLIEWTFPEFVRHDRGRVWYIAYAIVTLALLAYGYFSKNYTFIMFMVILTLILLIRLRRTPLSVRFAIRDEGIDVGNDYYAWRELKEFWILYRPPILRKIYFSFKSGIRPALDISLENENPVRIRQFLSERLLENSAREDEPAGDQLTRTLKL